MSIFSRQYPLKNSENSYNDHQMESAFIFDQIFSTNSLKNKCRPVWRICMWIRGTCPEVYDNFQTHPPVSLQAFLFVLWALHWCSAVYPSVASVSPFDP